jgi:chemotaxis protein CheD
MTLASNRVTVLQGEFHVSDDEGAVLTTILGSCVAACIRDPVAKIGGMNHFLLPGSLEASRRLEAESYGVHLMELLVNGLLRRGASRHRLEAKLFGGAQTMRGFSNVGSRNAAFAEHFLQNESIRVIDSSLGGELGRKLEYWPVSGRARQCYLRHNEVNIEQPTRRKPARSDIDGSVEFF